MTREQFITLETAELAKQAGFDWECEYRYIAEPDYREPSFVPKPLGNGSSYTYPASTQSVLQRWLREVKNIQIWSEFHNQRSKNGKDGWIACYGFYSSTIVEIEYTSIYPTYEAALEAGLQKCLTLLIEKQ